MFLLFDHVRLRTDSILAYRWQEYQVTQSKGFFKKEKISKYRIELYPSFLSEQHYVEEFEDEKKARERLGEIKKICSTFILIDEYYVNPKNILAYQLKEFRGESSLHFYTTLGESVYFVENFETVSDGLQRYRELSSWLPNFIKFSELQLNKDLVVSYELKNTGEDYVLSFYTVANSVEGWTETFQSRLQAEDRLRAVEGILGVK